MVLSTGSIWNYIMKFNNGNLNCIPIVPFMEVLKTDVMEWKTDNDLGTEDRKDKMRICCRRKNTDNTLSAKMNLIILE